MSKPFLLDANAYPWLFKKRRGGIKLTRGEIREIKDGRKKLRREMREKNVYTRHEFEVTASSLGLYFDKGRFLLLWLWLWHRGALAALLGAAGVAMGGMYAYSTITAMRGHFTINLSDNLIDQGFELSNTAGFENPTARIYGMPVEDAPCISITDLPLDVDLTDGSHNGNNYFAHTFYLAKRGEGTADYEFSLLINSESQKASEAIWVMLFEDGVPTIYAKASGQTGEAEYIPSPNIDRFGYKEPLFAENQYSVIAERAGRTYYRLAPRPFVGGSLVAEDIREDVAQDEVHKYTVVIWLEGDDPDCTNDLIGAHIGLQMDFHLLER